MKKLDEIYKDFFIAMYDINDNYIMELETFEQASIFFNMTKYHIMRNIVHEIPFKFGKTYVKLYLIKKAKINENYKRHK